MNIPEASVKSVVEGLTPAQTIIAKAMSEGELQTNIIAAAHQFGWLVMHTRPTETKKTYTNKKGETRNLWTTPYQGDPGFWDLTLVKNGFRIEWELKTEDGKLDDNQKQWLKAAHPLQDPGVYVRRPSDWLSGECERILKEG